VTLREKQSLFMRLLPRLLDKASELGIDVTAGELYRSPQEAARLASLGLGIKTSLHTQRLAIDLNPFVGGKYDPSGYSLTPLGHWWEAQSNPEYQCAWGGRFRDPGHFSIAHGGRK
jgi:hypothetical protein